MIDYDSRSWIRVIARVQGSVLPGLLPRVLLTAAIGAGAAWLREHHRVSIPTTAHTLVGVALGLLLVFRTNASYDRYWEGRKLFGTIINRSRDLVRQLAAYTAGEDAAARAARARVQRLVVVFYALVRQRLRGEGALDALGVELEPAERAALEAAATRPALVIRWISSALNDSVRAGRLEPVWLPVMDQNLTAMVDAWGGTERILRTPIPFAYAHHIKIFLAVFCFTAPFALVDSMHWFTPLASAVVAFGMFGIEEIGVEIEDPFGYDANDLPLDRFGETIARDTGEMLAERERAAGAGESR